MRLFAVLFIFAYLLPFTSPLPAEESSVADVPMGIVYQGRMKEDGMYVTGPRDLAVALYNAESDGDELWSESHSDVAVVSGLFQIVLGSQTALADEILAGGETWLQVSIAGGDPLPRQQLTSSPYARVAGMATSVASGSIEREALGSDLAGELDAILSRLEAVENHTATLEGKTAAISTATVNGQPTVRFSGVNVQIINGSGSTYDNANGRGNLIIGYNTQRPSPVNRSGSHNVVVGDEHDYGAAAMGGVVFGISNSIANRGASVTAGLGNIASGQLSSVTGGDYNVAQGLYSSISGGKGNSATGGRSSVSGGSDNNATKGYSSVSGGFQNTASGLVSSVSGGRNNSAEGDYSIVIGGDNNTTSGTYSIAP